MTPSEFSTDVGQIKATDVDECAEAHAPWEMRHSQLSLGKFRTQTDFVRNERVTVYRQWWNRRVLARGRSPAGYVVVGTATNGTVNVNWCGRDLSRERFAWTQPSGEIDFSTSERSDHVVALIRADVLAGYMGDAERATDPQGLHMDCPAQVGSELVLTIQSILTRYASQPDLLQAPLECQDFESEVISAVATCANWESVPEEDPNRRREAMRDAYAYAESRCEPITVPQLAQAVGVSQRTLEYAFREGLGITPLSFIRRCRLSGALRDLRRAPPSSQSVTAVATEWGFSDFGRFAAEYRRLFGSYPSQTLNRERSPIEPLLRMSSPALFPANMLSACRDGADVDS
jgi:AraC family ethanolamine operon transcriptional activator